MRLPNVLLVFCAAWIGGTPILVLAQASSPENLEFFEKQVRPLFAEHCRECHGEKKQEAGLRLDSRAGFVKGADTGPVVVSGNVDSSRVLKVLRFDPNDIQMPPKGKLADEQIGVIRKWLELGAPWPEETKPVANSSEVAKSHWSFQPLKKGGIPTSGDPQAQSAIDGFLLAALKAKGLQFSAHADRYTLIRRATLDLWGIPPKFEDVQEFEADASPDAYEKLVDRLLASPLYGQRWARHWLDVARYADSKGYVFTQEPRYPYSYTYRDYVVDAFNGDKPFDQFVIEQLAADAVVSDPAGGDPRLAALGFLTVGRRYLNNNNDIIDDRIDVVSRGLLGLTVGCARCHDHKFDPVPTEDYYSLYGVFASSTEPEELPLIGSPKNAQAYAEFEKELTALQKDVSDFEAASQIKLMESIRARVGDCLQVIARENKAWESIPAVYSGKSEPRRPLIERWKRYLDQVSKSENRVFGPWHRLSKLSTEEFKSQIGQLIEQWKSPENLETAKTNAFVRQAILDKPPESLLDLARLYGDLMNRVCVLWDVQRNENAEAKSLADPIAEELRLVLYGEGSPAVVNLEESRRLFERDVRDHITELSRKVENLKVTSPGAPPRAMVMRDGPLYDPKVFIRGNQGRQGKPVPRQFLQVVAGPERKPFSKGSGRLELAQAIVDRNNPLTPRVIVNRLWQHHFGAGLVITPSDFGTRGVPASNPELLDWLGLDLMDHGWNLKRFQRLILTSAAYRQSSAENSVARGIDPENRLVWRMPRLRLDFEEMRDSMLAIAGRLDASLGGRPFSEVMNTKNCRRTIYAEVNRNDLPGVFRAFDFADVDVSAPERPNTTVPQQALFAMNSPFVRDQARWVANECHAGANDDSGRLSLLYRRVFSREPTSEERELTLRYLNEALTTSTEKQSPWERLAQTLLLTNEFWFAD